MFQPKDRAAERIRKQDPYICCLQETHFRLKDTHRLKGRVWKKYCFDGPRRYFKSHKERQTLYDFTYMQNLRNKKNKLIENRLRNIVDSLVMNRVEEGLGNWENGVKG